MNQLGLRMLTKGLILAGAMDVAQQRKVGLAPFGTMALDRVFDSLRDNFNDVAVIPQPAVVVRTETDERSAAPGRGSHPGDQWLARRVDMRIEFGFWVKDDDGVGYPAADSRMEARLNMFEYQIEACLRGSHPWVALWQSYFTAETMTSNAVWFEDEEGRTKAAARELTIPCRVNPECLPYAHRYDEPQEVPAIPSPLAELIAEFKLRGGGDFLKYVLGIETVLKAEALPVGSVYPRLTTVYLRIPEAITPPGEKPNIILEGDVLDLPDD